MTARTAIALLPLLALGGCVLFGGGQPPAVPSIMDQNVPPAARKACLAEVASVAGVTAGDVTIIQMLYSPVNSQVTVGVGTFRTPWTCLVSNSGRVRSAMSQTDEGRR